AGRPARRVGQPHRRPVDVHRPHGGTRPRPGLGDLVARPRGPGPGLHARVGRRSGHPLAGGDPVIWLTWRQFRASLAAVCVVLVAACVWLAVTGPDLARLAHRNTDVYDLLTTTDMLLFDGGI